MTHFASCGLTGQVMVPRLLRALSVAAIGFLVGRVSIQTTYLQLASLPQLLGHRRAVLAPCVANRGSRWWAEPLVGSYHLCHSCRCTKGQQLRSSSAGTADTLVCGLVSPDSQVSGHLDIVPVSAQAAYRVWQIRSHLGGKPAFSTLGRLYEMGPQKNAGMGIQCQQSKWKVLELAPHASSCLGWGIGKRNGTCKHFCS